MMIALLFAGQHTSSVTGSWTGLLLLQVSQRVEVLPIRAFLLTPSLSFYIGWEQEEIFAWCLARAKGSLSRIQWRNEHRCLEQDGETPSLVCIVPSPPPSPQTSNKLFLLLLLYFPSFLVWRRLWGCSLPWSLWWDKCWNPSNSSSTMCPKVSISFRC